MGSRPTLMMSMAALYTTEVVSQPISMMLKAVAARSKATSGS